MGFLKKLTSYFLFFSLCMCNSGGISAQENVAAFPSDQAWQNFSYQVIHVSDGDTAVVTDGNLRMRVRFAGMDAPESGQPYGKLAQKQLENLILNKKVQIKSVGYGIDPYNRQLGQVFVDGQEVALQMINSGWATYYRPRCVEYPDNKNDYDYDPRPYVDAEAKAKSARLNIWSGMMAEDLPCVYRKEKKTISAQAKDHPAKKSTHHKKNSKKFLNIF
jgi:micrococcal nuclease